MELSRGMLSTTNCCCRRFRGSTVLPKRETARHPGRFELRLPGFDRITAASVLVSSVLVAEEVPIGRCATHHLLQVGIRQPALAAGFSGRSIVARSLLGIGSIQFRAIRHALPSDAAP